MEPDATGKSSWLTLVGKGKEDQPGALAGGHFLWGSLCLHLLESEGHQGSWHHGYSSRTKVEHSCLNTARLEDSMNKMLLITSGKEWTNPAVCRPRAGWGATPASNVALQESKEES